MNGDYNLTNGNMVASPDVGVALRHGSEQTYTTMTLNFTIYGRGPDLTQGHPGLSYQTALCILRKTLTILIFFLIEFRKGI